MKQTDHTKATISRIERKSEDHAPYQHSYQAGALKAALVTLAAQLDPPPEGTNGLTSLDLWLDDIVPVTVLGTLDPADPEVGASASFEIDSVWLKGVDIFPYLGEEHLEQLRYDVEASCEN
jgi:hypothetical protein